MKFDISQPKVEPVIIFDWEEAIHQLPILVRNKKDKNNIFTVIKYKDEFYALIGNCDDSQNFDYSDCTRWMTSNVEFIRYYKADDKLVIVGK